MRELSELYDDCSLCPRKCGAARSRGEVGVCGADSHVRVARAALHFWEEPMISAKTGSGTVFFAHCPMHCVYCQNYEISGNSIDSGKNRWMARDISAEELADVYFDLKAQGANNINLVSASHYAPTVAQSIRIANDRGLELPFILNSSGYESLETLRLFDGLIDVYLVDFKYMSSELAMRYSKAPDYADVAKKAIFEMVRQTEHLGWYYDEKQDEDILFVGVIVRHLMLPGAYEDSLSIFEYLDATYGSQIMVSLMSQYMPLVDAQRFPEIASTIDPEQYEKLADIVKEMSFEECFLQDPSAAIEEYIPEFDGLGIV